MTTEIKPGKWKLTDFGTEVIVLHITDTTRITALFTNGGTVRTLEPWEFENAEYLGPAVIGDPGPDVERNYWVKRAEVAEQKCKDMEAETVATRELLEQSEERCEELARQLEQPVKSQWSYVPVTPRAREAETKLASAQCVIEGLEERVRFLEEQVVESPAFDLEDGASVYRFKSVTVMVRDRQEASCHPYDSRQARWTARQVGDPPYVVVKTRELAEAWCRKQLEPRWREATEGDVGKACRVRDHEDRDWQTAEKLAEIIDHEFRFVAVMNSRRASVFRFCEVQE